MLHKFNMMWWRLDKRKKCLTHTHGFAFMDMRKILEE